MSTTKRPLCPACRENNGFICDDVTGMPVRKCPCRDELTVKPQTERDTAIAAAEAAHPGQSKAAYRIVVETAKAMSIFTANDCRHRMTLAGIENRNVIGGAFLRAAREGLIRKAGKRPSTDRGTHGHEITEWESLIYRVGAGAVAS